MKKFILGLMILASPVWAEEVAPSTAPIVVTIDTPVEHRVVELRMYKVDAPAEARTKKRSKPLPLAISHGTCSGAFISPLGDILTAKHCVDEGVTIEVMTHDRRSYQAVLVATSAVHDLALLHIDRRNTPFFNLATDVSRGQKVFILGSPLAITDVLATGIVARIDGDSTMLDCSALPGNSGGPVFDEKLNLIGVITSVRIVMFGVTHLSAAQGLDAIAFFLDSTKAKRKWFDTIPEAK